MVKSSHPFGGPSPLRSPRRGYRPEGRTSRVRRAAAPQRLGPLGPRAKPAVQSAATSPSRAGSLTPHRVNRWRGARLALCIVHGGSPILQTSMHPALIIKADPLGSYRIRLSQVSTTGLKSPIRTIQFGSSALLLIGRIVMDMFSPFTGVGHVLYLYHKMANFYRSAKVRESHFYLTTYS